MKLLATVFKRDGFTFRQLERSGQVAVFEKRKRPGRSSSYEVVRIRRLPARSMFGVDYPASEAMPVSERWGTDGWTYCDRDKAMAKFRELDGAHNSPALRTRQPERRAELVVSVKGRARNPQGVCLAMTCSESSSAPGPLTQ